MHIASSLEKYHAVYSIWQISNWILTTCWSHDMFAISLGINERKKMFILVVVGVIDSNFDVSEKYSVVG